MNYKSFTFLAQDNLGDDFLSDFPAPQTDPLLNKCKGDIGDNLSPQGRTLAPQCLVLSTSDTSVPYGEGLVQGTAAHPSGTPTGYLIDGSVTVSQPPRYDYSSQTNSLSPGERSVLEVIHKESKEGYAEVTQKEIHKRIGQSIKTVQRHLTDIVSKGYLRVVAKGSSTHGYEILRSIPSLDSTPVPVLPPGGIYDGPGHVRDPVNFESVTGDKYLSQLELTVAEFLTYLNCGFSYGTPYKNLISDYPKRHLSDFVVTPSLVIEVGPPWSNEPTLKDYWAIRQYKRDYCQARGITLLEIDKTNLYSQIHKIVQIIKKDRFVGCTRESSMGLLHYLDGKARLTMQESTMIGLLRTFVATWTATKPIVSLEVNPRVGSIKNYVDEEAVTVKDYLDTMDIEDLTFLVSRGETTIDSLANWVGRVQSELHTSRYSPDRMDRLMSSIPDDFPDRERLVAAWGDAIASPERRLLVRGVKQAEADFAAHEEKVWTQNHSTVVLPPPPVVEDHSECSCGAYGDDSSSEDLSEIL